MGSVASKEAAAFSEISQYKEHMAMWICLHQEHHGHLMLKTCHHNNQNWIPVA